VGLSANPIAGVAWSGGISQIRWVSGIIPVNPNETEKKQQKKKVRAEGLCAVEDVRKPVDIGGVRGGSGACCG